MSPPLADPFPEVPLEVGRHEVVPGLFAVTVYAYRRPSYAGPVDIWLALSDGLWQRGHPEILLCVRRHGEAREAWPRGVLDLFGSIYQVAHERTAPLTPGEVLSFEEGGQPGLFATAGFGGLALMCATVPPGMRATAPWVHAVPLTPQEEFTATRFGAVRMLSALGWTVREFPTIPWHDSKRAEVVLAPGLLEPMPRGRLIGVLGYLVPREPLPQGKLDAFVDGAPLDISGGRWWARLEIPRSQAAGLNRLLDDLGEGRTFGLLLDPDPDACAVLRLTSQAGSPGIMSGNHLQAGSVRIGLNHVAFVRHRDTDWAKLLEDGLAVGLSEPSMAKLHTALRSEEPILLSQPQFDLEIVWTEATYTNPFTDETLTRPYEYFIEPISASLPHCSLVALVVLGSRQEFASTARQDTLVELMSAILQAVELWAATVVPGAEASLLLVELALTDSGLRFRFGYQVPSVADHLDKLLEGLECLPAAVIVRHGVVTVHLTFELRSP